MSISPSDASSDKYKLDALRRLDQFRQWRSLDERRFCLVCGKIITGRQIRVTGSSAGNGLLQLSCATETCNSIPMDWVLLTDEILAVAEAATRDQHSVVSSKPTQSSVQGGLATGSPEFAW